MKLLCVIDNLDSGGAQRQLVNVACGLKARRHDIEFFTYYSQGHFKMLLDRAEIPVHCYQKESRWSAAPVLAMRRLIQRGEFDVILAYLETPAVYAELACFWLSGVRVIVSERSGVFLDKVSVGRYLKSQAHRFTHFIVINSHSHCQWLSRRFPFLRSKLRTIWNGIDLAEFRPSSSPLANKKTLHLLSVGRIQEAKNMVRLAEALGCCIRKKMPVCLDWVGRVEDNAYYQQVCQAIAAAGATAHWRWMGERKDIPELMRQYDAFILPSLWEGLPNVVCEALASGLPVLSSDVADNTLLVQRGVTGFLFNPQETDTIVQAISQFASLDPSARTQFRREARAFAERELSLGACVTAYERLLLTTPSFS